MTHNDVIDMWFFLLLGMRAEESWLNESFKGESATPSDSTFPCRFERRKKKLQIFFQKRFLNGQNFYSWDWPFSKKLPFPFFPLLGSALTFWAWKTFDRFGAANSFVKTVGGNVLTIGRRSEPERNPWNPTNWWCCCENQSNQQMNVKWLVNK